MGKVFFTELEVFDSNSNLQRAVSLRLTGLNANLLS
jgi:hypothetical protein